MCILKYLIYLENWIHSPLLYFNFVIYIFHAIHRGVWILVSTIVFISKTIVRWIFSLLFKELPGPRLRLKTQRLRLEYSTAKADYSTANHCNCYSTAEANYMSHGVATAIWVNLHTKACDTAHEPAITHQFTASPYTTSRITKLSHLYTAAALF